MNTNSKGWEIDLLPINESKQSGDCILLRFGDLFAGKYGHENEVSNMLCA